MAVLLACRTGVRGEWPADAVELPRLVHLKPGAVVDAGPPQGWSHRIIRSLPRLASGELASLPESARATATLLRTVITADVVRRGSAYRLARVGVGNAVPVGGREVVVTPDGPEAVLSTLSLIDRLVIRAAESKIGQGRLVARTSTFALFRTPSVLVVGGRHEVVDLYYALLVDASTGRLTTLTWSVPAGSGSAPGQVVVLPADLTFDVALDVQVSRRVGPVALSWSFAMRALPPGRRLAVPAAIGQRVAGGAATAIDPGALEAALKALAGRPTGP